MLYYTQMVGIQPLWLLTIVMQGFCILLYSVVELQRPGDENSDWLVQCKQSKHGLISENYRHVPCSMQHIPSVLQETAKLQLQKSSKFNKINEINQNEIDMTNKI